MTSITCKNPNGEVVTYKTAAEAARMNGATSGQSVETTIKQLTRLGFTEIVTTETTGTTERGPAKTLAERIIDDAKVVDSAMVKTLQADLNKKTNSIKTVKDAEEVMKLSLQLQTLKNPEITLDKAIAHATKLLQAHFANLPKPEPKPTEKISK